MRGNLNSLIQVTGNSLIKSASSAAPARDLARRQRGLHHLLFSSSLASMGDLAKSHLTGDELGAIESAERWRHATSALVEWHNEWAWPGSCEPLDQDISAAIRRARDWRILETILHGLGSGEMYLAESKGWDIRLGNKRDHAVEVLDIVLQQVSIPAPLDHPSPLMTACISGSALALAGGARRRKCPDGQRRSCTAERMPICSTAA